jgi:hypothetical protein
LQTADRTRLSSRQIKKKIALDVDEEKCICLADERQTQNTITTIDAINVKLQRQLGKTNTTI